MSGRIGTPAESVLHRTTMFFTDSVLCGLSALACRTNAPTVLRDEAADVPGSERCMLSGFHRACVAGEGDRRQRVGRARMGQQRHQLRIQSEPRPHRRRVRTQRLLRRAHRRGPDHEPRRRSALRGMVYLDEIRGRLAEVFLKSYKIDHVVHGAIASAAVYGAMLGATPEQIESAIGMVVAHYIPWRAIRAGHQLSDSKGASAAISTEVAILSMRRSMKGFIGPADIFRNPEAIWRQFEPTDGDSPFDLVLSHSGDDFAVMGMHFKLGLYEHQSAGALQGLIDLISANPDVLEAPQALKRIHITAYEPAYGIIGDPAKRDPHTRQSADHSMVYIVSTKLRKAYELAAAKGSGAIAEGNDNWWTTLMLAPIDYGREAIVHPETRRLMDCIEFEHGGPEYDDRYPDGIPTSLRIELEDGRVLDSGFVMYPSGHARNTTCDLEHILDHKASLLGALAMDDATALIERCNGVGELDAEGVQSLFDCAVVLRDPID